MSEHDQAIRTFIEHRKADARQALQSIDPAFVAKVDASVTASKIGLILPDADFIPTPSFRLSDRCHRLLSSAFEVIHELRMIETTLSFMNPAENQDVNRLHSTYFFEVWLQRTYNLCDKVTLMIKNTIRLRRDEFGLSEHYSLIEKYEGLVKIKVRNSVELLRSPLVHGQGGKGAMATRVITEEHQGWEVLVLGKPEMFDVVLDSFYEYEGDTDSEKFYEHSLNNDLYTKQALGEILGELEKELMTSSHE